MNIYIISILILIIILTIYIIISKQFDMFKNNWNNKIDGIVYINLEKREDRKKLILEELNKIEVDMDKVNKVSGIYTPKNGHKGCVQSHIFALNMAKMNKWKQVLIFEDDMELNVLPDEFNDKIDMALNYFTNNNNVALQQSDSKSHIKWDVLMLATGWTEKINSENEVVRIKSATTGSGYIVNNNYYDTLLTLFNDCNEHMTKDKWGGGPDWEPYALDQQWAKLQATDNWYGFKNDIVKQRNISSTTMNRN